MSVGTVSAATLSQAYPNQEISFTLSEEMAQNATAGAVTVTVGKGDYSKTNMFVNSKPGYIAGAAHLVDGVLNTSMSNGVTGNPDNPYKGQLYSSTTIIVGTLGDSEENAPVGIQALLGEGIACNSVVGDKNIIVNSGKIGTIYGGVSYESLKSSNLSFVGNTIGANMYAYKDASNPADVNITVNGGSVNQIRGGNSGKHKDYIAKVCQAAAAAGTLDELMANKPWSISGDVNISIKGGTVGTEPGKKAILGAGGSGHSVDGDVNINISGGAVKGNIYAGGSNAYAEVGGTNISISGGEIDGNVFGGGLYDDGPERAGFEGPAPVVKGNTAIEIKGGLIKGDVYGAGFGDTVEGNTSITLSGGVVEGTLYGGGLSGEADNGNVTATVKGTRTLTIGSAETAYSGSVAVADFTAISVVNGTVTLTACAAAPEGSDLTVEKDAALTVNGEAAFKSITLNGGSLTAANLTAESITLGTGNYGVLEGGYVAGDAENGFVQDSGRQSIGLTVNETGATVTDAEGVEYKYDEAKGQYTAAGAIHWETYYINTEEHTATVSEIAAASENKLEQVEMKAGVLNADASAKVNATGGSIHMTGQNVDITGTLSGETSVQVSGTGTITGDNTHTGGTVIAGENAKLTVGSATALGTGEVTLQNHGTLDLNGMEVSNIINVEGCTISRAANYKGEMRVSGDLTLTDAANAAAVMLSGNGTVSGAQLTTASITKSAGHKAAVDFSCSVTVLEGGNIFIDGDTPLSVSGTLTLGSNVTIHLSDSFTLNDTIVDADSLVLTNGTASIELEGTSYELTLNESEGSLVLSETETEDTEEEDTPIVDDDTEDDKPIVGPEEPEKPAPVFDQASADLLVQSNWGAVTTSRAFANAVQGQRNNAGCIAEGRGTAWVAALGGDHDIESSGKASGSDITYFGAAAGVDMRIGKRHSVGVAFGYTDGEVSPSGLSDVDQESSYASIYGEHGLKKFANNSYLSLGWVAGVGRTESDLGSISWEQDSVQVNTRVAWNKKVTDRFAYNVFGGLEYFASESDRVAGCKSGSVQNVRGELGMGVRYVALSGTKAVEDEKSAEITPACERVVLYGELSYINDMVRNNPVAEINGLRGTGANPGRQGVGIDLGATIRIGERWTANANYSFNAMDDSNEHSVNVGAAYTF